MRWHFDNSYARLPRAFFARVEPVPISRPEPVLLNRALAAELGLDPDALQTTEAIEAFAGNRRPSGGEPLAQAYAGHQFGHFTLLGDGRAHLLGEHLTPDGRRIDIQLKGSGPTPFSRRGDGRAALGPMLREYLISEAMHGLGIPTTRSLAVVATGERVFREQALPGAVLTRIAASHVRVGTFEYAAALDAGMEVPWTEIARVLKASPPAEYTRTLAEYVLARHYPELAGEEPGPARYLALLDAVMERQAALIAQWMRVGFVHGVMNTDNMTLSGETIDYGPCAFMDRYDPATVFSSIDRQGRYAFGNQPGIAQWNLARLAETLLPLLHPDPDMAVATATESVQRFPEIIGRHWRAALRAKLGLVNQEPGDTVLADALLQWMQRSEADYTNTFRDLADTVAADHPQPVNPAFADRSFAAWHERWRERLTRQPGDSDAVRRLMCSANPAVIPRNHRVEEALEAAVETGDLDPLQALLAVLEDPYHERLDRSEYRQPPAPEQRVYQTFCGT